jgi:hypothetical protein
MRRRIAILLNTVFATRDNAAVFHNNRADWNIVVRLCQMRLAHSGGHKAPSVKC